MRFVKLDAKQSAELAIDAVSIFWNQARIPIRQRDKCVSKLLKIYEEWKNHQKTTVHKLSAVMKQKYDSFISNLGNLFDSIIQSKISIAESEQIKDFCRNQLQRVQIRGDYQELLELAITFLGGNGGVFRTCGATSHARFMSKCIYCLKMFLFRDHFRLTSKELNCIREFSIFVVKLYIKAWYGCTNAIKAPNQDLNFLREAFEYAQINVNVSNAVVEKMKNHLWYLTPLKVGMGLFDSNVSLEVKRKMINRLKAKDPIVTFSEYRKYSNAKQLLNYDLSDSVSHQTILLFSYFQLDY